VGLFVLNAGAYLVLWILTLMRLARFRGRLLDDLTHHSRGATFITIDMGFPLGMYAVATFMLVKVTRPSFLKSSTEIGIAADCPDARHGASKSAAASAVG